ncbi:hypothetical protein [Effusibacillus consociatus]|uniref:Uncharacterized protein n=1 Tax=Effusibacillus consociatus TaxID=1117041 RepID=A0ABV9Q711_9BACL
MSFRKRTAFLGTMVLTLGVGFMLGQVGKATNDAVPGSADDPVVTKSYVDSKLAGGTPGTAAGSFAVVKMQQGQILKASTEAGLEVILRNGTATAISGPGGGLSDVTAGVDLNTGNAVATNHLLLFARNDGRGLKITSGGDSYLVVRGAYTIQ